LHYQTIAELSGHLRRGALSPVEVTDHLLGRIEASPHRGYVSLAAERARDRAKAAEAEIAAGNWRGPLHGVPLAVKDNIFTDFAPTTGGAALYKDHRPAFTATAVARLEAAGAIVIGKAKTTELAWSAHHPSVEPPLNPWDPDRFPGVSSSGSGVVTAAGLAYGALGTDTGASVRMPAAANGVTGLKTTRGRVSRHGVFLLSSSLDTVGPLTRSALDAAIMLQAFAGHDRNDPTTLDAPLPDYAAACAGGVAGLRIGLIPLDGENVAGPVADAIHEAAKVLESLGATICQIALPDPDPALRAKTAITLAEASLAHRETYPSRSGEYGPSLRAFLGRASGLTAADVASGYIGQVAYSNAVRSMFRSVDAVLTPTLPVPVPTVAEFETMIGAEWSATDTRFADFLRFLSPVNLSGNPSIALPGGFDPAGMPLSLQIIGPHLSEALLLRIAAAFQRVTDWHARRPADFHH